MDASEPLPVLRVSTVLPDKLPRLRLPFSVKEEMEEKKGDCWAFCPCPRTPRRGEELADAG